MLRFTPQYYEETIKSLEREIESLEREIESLANELKKNPPDLWRAQYDEQYRYLAQHGIKMQQDLQGKVIERPKISNAALRSVASGLIRY